jgi:hypothetical protein
MSMEQKQPAGIGPVERVVRPLVAMPASDGFYLLAPKSEDVLMAQPEPKWQRKQEDAERHAIAIAERTGIAVFVVSIVSKVVPWHQDMPQRPNVADKRHGTVLRDGPA